MSSGDGGVSRFLFAPEQVVAGQGVEDGEEFAHAGGHGDFVGLAGGGEALEVLGDDGVAPDGREGGHVQGGADRGASAADVALAALRAAVAVERGQPGQGLIDDVIRETAIWPAFHHLPALELPPIPLGTLREPIKREEAKVGRNDPCPCGSGKKFKKCCGA